jgi:hypothetical protein
MIYIGRLFAFFMIFNAYIKAVGAFSALLVSLYRCETLHRFFSVPLVEMSLLDFIDTSKLSELTKNQYASKAVKLMDIFKKSLSAVIQDAETSIEKLKELYTNKKTLKGYIAFIQTVFKYNPEFKSKHKDAYQKWDEMFKTTLTEVMDGLKENKPSEKQREGFVEYKDIRARVDTLPKGSEDRLIVALYGMMPPLRADFNDVVVYRTKPKKSSTMNYIVLNKTKRKGNLYLNEYKTAKTYGQIDREFGADLYQEITDSLAHNPRTYLFESKDGQPYEPNTFTKFINRRLKTIFGKPLTISLIRHSFINSIDMNRLTVKQKEELAHDMGHSVGTQDLYRLVF